MKRRPRLGVALLVVVLVAAGGVFAWRQWLQTYHLATVEEGILYRDGNRGLRELETAVRKVKPRTVVMLIDEEEMQNPGKPQFKEEVDYLKSQGVAVERLPIKLGGWPTTADIQRFLAIVEDKGRRPILVHCAQGVRRTGMMAAAWQESGMGWSSDKAKNAILDFSHSPRTIEDVKRFVDVYDPVKREMTRALGQSEEN